MKKIILMTALATAVFTANAQDIKPYEEKMSQIEAQYKKLEADYQAFGKKDPTTFTEADKATLHVVVEYVGKEGKSRLSLQCTEEYSLRDCKEV